MSHVALAIRPTDALGLAPKLPSIEASIYCMSIDESCAKIAGRDNWAVSASCCLVVKLSPSRIRESSFWVFGSNFKIRSVSVCEVLKNIAFSAHSDKK